MQNRSKLILVLLATTFISSQVYAQSYGGGRSAKPIPRTYGFLGTLLDFSLYYSQTEATATPATGNTWQNTTSIYDLKLGYINENQVYFGGIYSMRNDNQVSANRVYGNSVGLGLGYFGIGGFNIRGFYKFNDTYGDYKDGTGYQAELGYAINPTSSFYLGLCFSIREMTYKTNANIAGFQSWVHKQSYPFVTLGFLID
jgi:hypothetical protein